MSLTAVAFMVIAGCTNGKAVETGRQQTATADYELVTVSRTVSGKPETSILVAKEGDYTVQQTRVNALPPVIDKMLTPPDVILLNGWIYVTGDKPSVVVQNILIAQAEGSRMIVAKLPPLAGQSSRHRVLVLETGPGASVWVSLYPFTGRPRSLDEGEYLDVIKATGGAISVEGPWEMAGQAEVDLLLDEVRQRRADVGAP
jgi:hypothetical protein